MNEFVNGLLIKKTTEKDPEFVKFRASIKRVEMLKFLDAKQEDWVNIDILESKDGTKLYAVVNNWKPKPKLEVDGEVVPF